MEGWLADSKTCKDAENVPGNEAGYNFHLGRAQGLTSAIELLREALEAAQDK